MHVPARSRKDLKRLFGQQFWLFGCDIRRPEGNLLATLGFEKRKAPGSTTKAPSRYTWRGDHAPAVTLWGFGMLWSDEFLGDAFLSRHTFAPLYPPAGLEWRDAWEPGAIEGLRTPADEVDSRRCQHLVLDAMAWLGEYERFVVAECGHAYRDEAIAAWKWPCGCAASLAGRWSQARTELEASFGMDDVEQAGLVVGRIAPGCHSLAM